MAINIQDVFQKLSAVRLNKEELKSKGDFTYVPWAVAQRDVMSLFPETQIFWGDIRQLKDKTCLVKTKVTIAGVTKEQELPVQNFRCQALTNPNCNDINKAFQRCTVKNLSQFGYGMSLYLGEDPFDYSQEGAKENGQIQSQNEEEFISSDETQQIDDDDEILSGDLLELASEADLLGLKKERLIEVINMYCDNFEEEGYESFEQFEKHYKEGKVMSNVQKAIKDSLKKFLKEHITKS
tara:strand:- start:119 stop:832 length:714 start_codon:yes stop_codon:yes gene_type:complete